MWANYQRQKKNLKTKWEKWLFMTKGSSIRLQADFSSVTMEDTKQWDDI